MDKHIIQNMKSRFDQLGHMVPDSEVEFWFARELQEPLGYTKWERFILVIRRSIESCKTTGYDPDNHFRGVTKMVRLGSGAQRNIEDFMLTRYACYRLKRISRNSNDGSSLMKSDWRNSRENVSVRRTPLLNLI